MEQIKIIGIKELDDSEVGTVNRLAKEYYSKIQRAIKNITSLVIHVKSYEKTGNRKKYSVSLKVVAPTRTFDSKAAEWELAKALHLAFNKVERMIEHRFHD
ncbi:hypothetical protein FP803_01220 [Candidatus Woesearchaeota archaeon]|nr:hypothetical protein [Candidatus Woesearchaeota archaeon]